MKTNIKLDAQTVEIPLETLIEVVKIAAGLSKIEVERNLQSIQTISFYDSKNLAGTKNLAVSLSQHSELLAESLEVWYALEESKSRENLIISKP